MLNGNNVQSANMANMLGGTTVINTTLANDIDPVQLSTLLQGLPS